MCRFCSILNYFVRFLDFVFSFLLRKSLLSPHVHKTMLCGFSLGTGKLEQYF